MPWDTGPVVMFYRRDFYEKAGVDPAIDQDLGRLHRRRQEDDEANPGVVMATVELIGDNEWFRMLANEQGCGYFSDDGQSITINQPGCVAALEKMKEMVDAGIMAAATGASKIQNNKSGAVATPVLRRLVRRHDPLERAGPVPASGAST